MDCQRSVTEPLLDIVGYSDVTSYDVRFLYFGNNFPTIGRKMSSLSLDDTAHSAVALVYSPKRWTQEDLQRFTLPLIMN